MAVNDETAGLLREIAGLLESQKANPFRVNAYRRAANTLGSLKRIAPGYRCREGYQRADGTARYRGRALPGPFTNMSQRVR